MGYGVRRPSLYSPIPSVFNFWEPLHYLDRGHGFQTWETSPQYAIRSYAYILLHLVSVKIPILLFGDQKVGWSRKFAKIKR
jgi:hypothetical protein